MATRYEHNLFALKRQLELKTGRAYTWREISQKSGIHVNTLNNLAGNETRRVDLDILARLVDFFNAEDYPVSIGDLFIET